jgi:hypothetical protein
MIALATTSKRDRLAGAFNTVPALTRRHLLQQGRIMATNQPTSLLVLCLADFATVQVVNLEDEVGILCAALVPLTCARFTIISECDEQKVSKQRWQFSPKKQGTGYASGSTTRGGRQSTLFLHRFILDAPPGLEVDHKNRNGLDNRRQNLRLATKKQNAQNRALNRNSVSGVHGVHWSKNERKWKSSINVDGTRVHLGYFKDIDDAVRAYDAAARLYYGEFANLNSKEGSA